MPAAGRLPIKTKNMTENKKPNLKSIKLKEIQELLKSANKNNIAELNIEQEGYHLIIKTHNGNATVFSSNVPVQTVTHVAPQVVAPAQATAPVASAAPAPATSSEGNYITIKSPMIGTFYRSGGPDKEPFVKPGDSIQKGSVLCVIEAMKLFNEIESEHAGKIVKILVENASPVEYDQPLFLVEPN